MSDHFGKGHSFGAGPHNNPLCYRCGCPAFTLIGDEFHDLAKQDCPGRKAQATTSALTSQERETPLVHEDGNRHGG